MSVPDILPNEIPKVNIKIVDCKDRTNQDNLSINDSLENIKVCLNYITKKRKKTPNS